MVEGCSTYVLDLVLVKVWSAVDDHPWNRAAKVDNLVHEERHDARGKDIVTNESVPCSPEAFKVVELNIVFRNLFKLTPVCAGLVWERVLEEGGRVAVRHMSACVH